MIFFDELGSTGTLAYDPIGGLARHFVDSPQQIVHSSAFRPSRRVDHVAFGCCFGLHTLNVGHKKMVKPCSIFLHPIAEAIMVILLKKTLRGKNFEKLND
jgi:hypothetical protein